MERRMFGLRRILALFVLTALVMPALAEEVDDLILDLLGPYGTNKNPTIDALAEKGEPAVDPLIDVLKDKDLPFRNLAANALGKIGDPRAVESLIEALKDENEFVREETAYALGKIGDPRAVESLIEAFPKEEDRFVKEALIVALGDISDPMAVDLLIEALKDANEFIRRDAANALGKIGDPRAVESLIEALNDEEEYARGDAAYALGEIGDLRAVDPLIKALKDEDGFVRIQATYALGEIGDLRAVDPLIVALQDEDEYVRKGATHALGSIGDAKAIEPLKQALKDEYGEVQEEAAHSLEKLGQPTDQLAVAMMDEEGDAASEGIFQLKQFQFKRWGRYCLLDLNGTRYFAAYVDEQINEIPGKPFLSHKSKEINLAVNRHLSEVLIDNINSTTITSSRPLELREGYELHLKSIDGLKANLELRKDEQIIDSKVVAPGKENAIIADQTYYYRTNLGETKDIIIIAVHFKNAEDGTAFVDGIFQISDKLHSMDDLGISAGNREIGPPITSV
jgi:HEAT repeat protein